VHFSFSFCPSLSLSLSLFSGFFQFCSPLSLFLFSLCACSPSLMFSLMFLLPACFLFRPSACASSFTPAFFAALSQLGRISFACVPPSAAAAPFLFFSLSYKDAHRSSSSLPDHGTQSAATAAAAAVAGTAGLFGLTCWLTSRRIRCQRAVPSLLSPACFSLSSLAPSFIRVTSIGSRSHAAAVHTLPFPASLSFVAVRGRLLFAPLYAACCPAGARMDWIFSVHSSVQACPNTHLIENALR